MKRWIVTAAICLMLTVSIGGCEGLSIEGLLVGAGIGAAGKSALDATEESLQARKAELEAQKADVLQEIKDANTPEELSIAEKKLAVIDNSIFANRAALQTVQQIKAVTAAQTPEGRKDAIAVGAVGLIGIVLEEWRRRLQGKKYVSMKAGQARLKVQDPKAEETLYAIIGEERRARGL